jgi:hypothetical protein
MDTLVIGCGDCSFFLSEITLVAIIMIEVKISCHASPPVFVVAGEGIEPSEAGL